MATEYKLSFTAEEIDRRLGEVDKIADLQSQIDELSKNQSTEIVETEHPFSKLGFCNAGGEIYYVEGAPSSNTDYISLEGIHTIKYKVNLSDAGYEIAFYDSNKEFMPTISVKGQVSYSEKEIDLTKGKYTNAAYVIVSHYGDKTPLCITVSGSPGSGIIDTVYPFSEQGYYSLSGSIEYWDGDPSLNTGYVPLDKVHTIQYKTHLNEYGYEVAFFDSDKNLMSEISVVGTSNRADKEIDLTENKYNNVAYAIVSNYGEASPYCKTISGYDANNVNNVSTKGKTMLIFGDSITETAYMNDDGSNYEEDGWMNWPIYAREILQLKKIWNFAKSGAAYKDRTDVEERQKISQQISSAIASGKPADIIVISAGTNDGNNTIGDYSTAMSKTSLDDLDRTNLYEALRWAMWKLKTQYPDAVCFAATPIQRADREPIPELTEAIIKMANRYNFIVIPAENESGIVRDNEVWQAAGHDLMDGLHPNENGQKKMARLYSSYILNHYIKE